MQPFFLLEKKALHILFQFSSNKKVTYANPILSQQSFLQWKNFAMSMYIVQKEGEKGIISQFVYYILLNFCKG